jgi:FkbM family methyltransferase
MNYSQSGEQNAILRCCEGRGWPDTFVDIGAFDGVKYSNTRALALAGWKGVCVEPDPRNFVALRETYKGNKNVQLINVALGTGTNLIRFVDTGDEYARFADNSMQSNVWVMQVTWDYLMRQFTKAVTVLSIDAEGQSVPLLFAAPIDAMAPHVICVEHDGRNIEVAKWGSKLGYEVCCLNEENIVLWK